MKKILIGIIVLLNVTSLFGQKSFGVRYGQNFSQLYLSPSRTQDFVQGQYFGLSFIHLENNVAGILVEGSYFQKAWKTHTDSSSYQRTEDMASFTFYTRFSIGKKKNKFLIDLGPSLSYSIQGNEKAEGALEEFDRAYSYSDGFDRWDFSLGLGFGYQFLFQDQVELEIGTRLIQTLTNQYNIEDFLYSLPQQVVLSAAVRYRITK